MIADPRVITSERLPPPAWPVLDLLACPACVGSLQAGREGGLACAACGIEWPERDGWLDFRPRAGTLLDADWEERQRAMERWYEGLITASDQAEQCFRHDYEPLAPLLRELRGVVIDVGGGNGIVRQYLSEGTQYVDLDPTVEWLSEDWLAVASSFPALSSPITFVLGVGERLPFSSGRVDAVLSLFSINHAVDPERMLSEAHRVLRPGGRLLIVAEDVEPRWRDLLRRGYRDGWVPLRRAIPDKLASSLGWRPWPLDREHVRTSEAQLRSWLSDGFELRTRAWIAGWLTLDATKRGA